jgi:hypothetical protein
MGRGERARDILFELPLLSMFPRSRLRGLGVDGDESYDPRGESF